MAEKRRIKRHKPDLNRSKIRQFRLGEGLPDPKMIRRELKYMRKVLLGHEDPPVNLGLITLMEVAEGYFSRACDLEQLILAAEGDGRLPKNKDSRYHTLRTQEIRSFKEMAKSAAELGSRRISAADLRYKQETTGRESAG